VQESFVIDAAARGLAVQDLNRLRIAAAPVDFFTKAG